MKRRKFLALLGGAAVACPLAVRAQQAGKLPTVALIIYNVTDAWSAAFTERLRELGWIEGRTVAIEYRWSEGRPEHIAEVAAELAQQNVLCHCHVWSRRRHSKAGDNFHPNRFPNRERSGRQSASSQASRVRAATSRDCRSRPPESAGKRLDLLRQLVPSLRRLAILFDATYPAAVLEKDNVQASGSQSWT